MSGMNVLDMSRVVLLVERSHGADLVFFMYSRNVRGTLFDRFANAKRQQVLLPESCPFSLAKALCRRAGLGPQQSLLHFGARVFDKLRAVY